ncbi:MAG: chemotaxis protein MotB [Gammaproteobacteria bacterium]|jgi:chemotaxis protein MotB
MALSRRSSGRSQNAIWPGFVDAMTGLLLVLMFVLTIFMVIQFVLRETITGQASRLDELAAEISTLASALGLEQDRSASLTTNLADVTDTSNAQSNLISLLTKQRDDTEVALVVAQNQITGFEAQVAGLLADRSDARAAIADLEGAQTQLLTDQEALNLALAQARTEIDAGTEAARLAAARRNALEALIADLETGRDTNTTLILELEATKLVDAAAAQALRARLENADAELTAMSLSLEEKRREAENTLTLLAAANAAGANLDMKLAAALLAQQNAENGMTRALSEGEDLDVRLLAALGLQQTTAAELAEARAQLDTSAANSQDLTLRLAAALADGNQSETALDAARTALNDALQTGRQTESEIQEQLAAALLAKQALVVEMTAIVQSGVADDAVRLSLEDRLAAALLANETLQARVSSLAEGASETAIDRASLQARLAEALAAMAATQAASQVQMTVQEQQSALLAIANTALSTEKALSAEGQRQVAALNAQVAELRQQVGTLQTLLNLADEADTDTQVQIQSLGTQLNTALARVAAEERRRLALETAERQRLEQEAARLTAEAQNLERFKSDFFGQLRDVLEGQDRVRIEGDRFVFSSEVLFEPGRATLSDIGRGEMANIADILRGIEDDIPAGIDWVIRVDGHTDDVPLSGVGQYANNWELSQARALSVVLYMVNFLGIAPDRLAANGFGQYQPLNPADTPDARAQNRRIELKLTER